MMIVTSEPRALQSSLALTQARAQDQAHHSSVAHIATRASGEIERASHQVLTRFDGLSSYTMFTRVVIMVLIMFITLSGVACNSTPVIVEGPPSLSVIFAVNDNQLEAGPLLTRALNDPLGAQALRLTLMRRVLIQEAAGLGARVDQIRFEELEEWRARLPRDDQREAELYIWLNLVQRLSAQDEARLRARFKRAFPRGQRFIGRQVALTPAKAWTEDQYERQLGYLRSHARLKLTQLRHQLIEGASFSQLAAQHSHHESAQRGGLISVDSLNRERVEPHVVRAARDLRLGEVSPVLQDARGAYLLYREDQERALSVNAEGVFWPKARLESLLKTSGFWETLNLLCERSHECALKDLLPDEAEGARWREAWAQAAPNLWRTSRASGKRRSSRARRRRKDKRDARQDSGGERSWSSIKLARWEASGASYEAQVSAETIREIHQSRRGLILTRGPLNRALPIIFTARGVWLLRIRGRSISPALAQPRLRLMSFDLTLSGLHKHWGRWGVKRVGEQVREAARHHRLDEALAALHIESAEIEPELLSSQLIEQLLSVSLDGGSQLLTEVKTTGDQAGWTLIQLDRRVAVSFEAVRAELIEKVEREAQQIERLRAELKRRWSDLKVDLFLARNDINLEIARSVGFTREIKVEDD